MRPTFDVVGLGAVAVDDVIYVASYPPADSKVAVLSRERHCGGLAAVALIAASRLGGRCAYAGVLGTDELSSFCVKILERERIDVSFLKKTTKAQPIHSNIVVDQQRGTRNIFFDLRGVVGAPLKVPYECIARSKVLLIDNFGVDGMIRAAKVAREHHVPVVADFESINHPRFGELLTLTDHLILSREVVEKMVGKKPVSEAVMELGEKGHEVVIVTCGAEGCWFLANGSKTPRHQKAFKITPADTTGCGDVFHGAYAIALARNSPLEERVRFASAAAALKAKTGAGEAGIPNLSAVRKLMKQT